MRLTRIFSTHLYWLLLLCFAMPVSLSAIELNEYVSDAITAHPSVREQVHVFRQVDRDRAIAASGWKPSVDLQASVGSYETESPTTGGLKREYESNRAELSVTQNVFNGFDTQYQLDQTSARSSSALYSIYDTADNIALQAVQAYLDVLKQMRMVSLAETNVSSHERILSQIRERNESGVGRRSELQQTEGRVARAHASLIAQQNNLQDAATRLHEVLGRYVSLKQLNEPVLPAHPGAVLDQLIDRALEQHPAIRVASYNIQAALSEVSRSKKNYYPKVDVKLAKEVGDDINGFDGETDELSLVLNVSYNFYRGGADRAEQRKKISAVHQNQEFAAGVRRQVINTLRLSWAADLSLSRQLKFLTTHIEKARETVESYGEEFFIGQRDLLDLLDAEGELNNAQIQHVEAYYSLMAARFRIFEAMGELFPALSLDVALDENDLRISSLSSSLRARGEDWLPYHSDKDRDKEKNESDHCDNTQAKNRVNDFGCHNEQTLDYGFTIVNQAPQVMDDHMKLEVNSVLVIPQRVLLENDLDSDGDDLKLIDFTQPKQGNIAFDERKNLIYRAADGFEGIDTFTYSVTDGKGAVATATVTLDITSRSHVELSKTQYVNFVYRKTWLTDDSEAKIRDFVEKIKSIPYEMIEVFAYTDNIGSDSYNLALSERRAQAMRKQLIKFGLDGASIKAYGMGEKHPIADNATAEGQAINRRGELRAKFGTPDKSLPRPLLIKNTE